MDGIYGFILNNSFLVCGLIVIGIIGMLISRHKLKGLKQAEFIVENQFKPADPQLLDQGYHTYNGEALARYSILVERLKEKYDHNDIKVGQDFQIC